MPPENEILSNAKKIITNFKSLPTPSAVLAEALSITADLSVSYEKVVKVVSKDPNISSRILRIANSPYYGLPQRVTNLQLALVILGIREFRSILISSAMIEMMRFKELKNSELFNNLWKKSFLMASIAKHLNTYLKLEYEGEEFVTGLLGNLGILILLSEFPNEYSEILKTSANIKELLKKEFNMFKCYNSDIVYILLSEWELPPILADSIWRQYPLLHTSLSPPIEPKLSAIAKLARFATEYVNNKFSETEFIQAPLTTFNLQLEKFIADLDNLISEKIAPLNFSNI
ncbi:MAG: HDOD domain-containing protein [Candidatus Hydrogenedentes bacterium]|nr:HDOD domain-containing protein [Candidatus Hydrogenedentota bacterium]